MSGDDVSPGWAIGILTGPSPLALSPRLDAPQPVLSRTDISDVDAQFVADPFMVQHGGRWHMFFEILRQDNDRGEIGLAVSDDAVTWEYRGVVLAEPFHLSYPHVFAWRGAYYMTPETVAPGYVSLYRATEFPARWRRLDPILAVRCADPTIFHANGAFWMLACSPICGNCTLRLYWSRSLFGGWREHPRSPIVAADASRARPAGRVVQWSGRTIRFAQDCSVTYGERVRAFEMEELSPTEYRETEVDESPVLNPSGRGWNAAGMHHVDAHEQTPGCWIACVDGC